MFNWRFTPYIITGSIIALLCVSYLGYRAYQDHIEFEVLIKEAEEFQLAYAADSTGTVGSVNQQITQRRTNATSPTSGLAINQTGRSNTHGADVSKMAVKVKIMPPEKVARYSHGDQNGSVVIRNSPLPKIPSGITWTGADLVTQFLELPNGIVVETRILPGTEIQEGDEVSLKYVAIHTPPENAVEIDGVEHKIPPGVDRHQHLQKLFWSHELGVSVKEADRMIANRELIVKSEGESMTNEEEGIMFKLLRKIPKFDSFLRSERPDLYEAEAVHDGINSLPSESREIEPGKSNTSSYPRQSPWEDSTPIPQSLVERQLPVPSESPTVSSQKTEARERVSPERFSKAQQLIDQYGMEEGLRRLRESDPEAARQFKSVPRSDREHRGAPSRDVPKDDADSDGQVPDDSP